MTVIVTRFLRNTQCSQTELCMQVNSHLQLVVLNQARVLSNTQQEHDTDTLQEGLACESRVGHLQGECKRMTSKSSTRQAQRFSMFVTQSQHRVATSAIALYTQTTISRWATRST